MDADDNTSRSIFQPLRDLWHHELKLNHPQIAVRASFCTNIAIVLSMTGVAISAKSLALLSALVENVVDLMVQGLLCYASARSGKSQDRSKFPVGTSRFEPVAVVVAASMMMLISVVFIENGSVKLIDGFGHGNPEAPTLSLQALVIAAAAISTKIAIIFYTQWVLRFWPSAAVEAIHADNRNDVISNSFAIVSYVIASANPKLWYVDSCGAIVIFALIGISWFRMGKEQMMQLVGVCATPDFISEITSLCAKHNSQMTLDMVRAYHFGSKYLVELEVVMPGEMAVKEAHDIALQLQFKVEQRDDVERAFVHVDYQQRAYDEHIVSHEQDALLVYTGYHSDASNDTNQHTNTQDSTSCNNTDNHSTPQEPMSPVHLDVIDVATPRDGDESHVPFHEVVLTVSDD